jgi:hypothetical protein
MPTDIPERRNLAEFKRLAPIEYRLRMLKFYLKIAYALWMGKVTIPKVRRFLKENLP